MNGEQPTVDIIPKEWKELVPRNLISAAVDNCAYEAQSHLEGHDVVIVCILKGAVYFHVDLSRVIRLPHSSYFIEASSYKSGTRQGEMEILSKIVPSKFQGKKILLIDELYDNGKTLHDVRQAIMNEAQVDDSDIVTCTLFKKEKETKYPPPDIYGMIIPDVWVVGYGLDDQQKKRNLRDLWAIPKADPEMMTDGDRQVFGTQEAYEAVYTGLTRQVYKF